MLSRVLAYPPRRSLMAYHSWKPNIELAPICPRCDCSITEFCYYNIYSLTQPRYFCKGCKRYWTKGGTLRNVPVGGGCRKNRRGKSARPQASHPTSHGDLNYDRHGALPDSYRSSHAQHESDLHPSESFSVIGGAQNSAMNRMPLAKDWISLEAGRSRKLYVKTKRTRRTATSLWIQAALSWWHSPRKELLLVMTFLCHNVGLPHQCPGFQSLLQDDMFHHQDLVIGDHAISSIT